MILDVHTHIFPDNIAEKVVESLLKQASEDITPAGKGSMAELLRQMTTTGIDQAVVCPVATKPGQFESILEFSLSIVNGDFGSDIAEMLTPLASIHPSDPLCFKQLEKISTKGIKGIKLHPYYQRFDLNSVHAFEILRCCRDLDLIVMCHCGRDIGFPPQDICTPLHVLNVYEKLPDLKFIAAHLGGYRQWKEVLSHLIGLPVFLDTSILEADLNNDEALEILERHPAKKLLLASDWPWCPLDRAVGLIRGLNRSDEEKALILGGNAAKLLG